MKFWRANFRREEGTFKNDHFEKIMLAMAGEVDHTFVSARIVADFGCGPRGSLNWAAEARERIGIDILADRYREFGTDHHNMKYVQSSETSIPLPTASIDVLFTLNALDHVVNLDAICRELLRVLKPGGELIGYFNLNEPPRIQEPQTLTESKLARLLFRHLVVTHRKVAPMGEDAHKLRECFDAPSDLILPAPAGPAVLWIRGRKVQGQGMETGV